MKANQKLKVGEKYIVRSWESMKKEYGLEGEFIKTPAYFVNDMKKYCGQKVTIAKGGHRGYFYNIIEDNGKFVWDPCMLTTEDSLEYLIDKGVLA